jgi:hypothetical protein
MFSKASDVASAISQTVSQLAVPSPYLAPPASDTPEPLSEGEPPLPGNATSGASGKKKKKKAAGTSQPGSALSSSPANLDIDQGLQAVTSTSTANGTDKAPKGESRATTREGRGMVLDRIGEGGLDGVQGEMTGRLIGFEGLILEEDVASGAITAVTIYEV